MDVLVGFVTSQEVTNLALTLIHFVWQGAIIAAGLWCVLLLTPRNKFKFRYRSAVVALILSVASPIATFSYLNQNPDMVFAKSAQVSQVNGEMTSLLLSSKKESYSSNSEGVIHSVPINNIRYKDFLGYILMLWLLGCVFMTFKFILDLNRTFKLTREGVSKVSNRVEWIVSYLSCKYQLKRRITILKSRKVNVPVVIGWLRPVILLPIAITIGLETKHLELIIAHELAHIKRMDFAVNLFQSIVQICLFYHPVIYWINKVIRDEREYICDQLALEVLGNDESAKINLAKALLGTEELREGNLSLVAVAASGGMLKHRISHILDSQYKPATSIKSLFIGALVFLFSYAALSTTFDLSNSHGVSAVQVQIDNGLQVNFSNRQVELKDQLKNERISQREAKIVTQEQNLATSMPPTAENVAKSKLESTDKVLTVIEKNYHTINKADSAQIANSNAVDSKKLTEKKTKKTLSQKITAISKTFKEVKQPRNLVVSKDVKSEPLVSNNLSKINAELYRELSNKALTEQYLLPEAVVTKESRYLRTAALDLQSVASFKEPKAIFTPYPKYPRRAWDKMINQTVRVNFSITKDGTVGDISIMEGADREFSREITRKLRSWKYKPAIKNGENAVYSTSLEFVFKAPQEEPVILITTGTRIRRR